MLDEYYVQWMIRERERERAARLPFPNDQADPGEERPVLSADWSRFSLRRFGSVLGTIGVALAASLALPASILALAWGVPRILELLSR